MTGTAAPSRIGIRIEPMDVLMFRDGRPFEATSRVSTGQPTPQTLAGAMRTALLEEAGCDFRALSADVKGGASVEEALGAQGDTVAAIAGMRVRGPWYLRDDGPVVSAPSTLRRSTRSSLPVRLDPLESPLPGWVPGPRGSLPLWARTRDRLEPLRGFLTYSGLRAFLEGGVPDEKDILAAGDIFAHDSRVGIAVDREAGTASQGMIYAAEMLSLRPGVSLYAELLHQDRDSLDRVKFPDLLRLGGEGRWARTEQMEKPVSWPDVQPGDGVGVSVVLTTPAPFATGRCPRELTPVAASVSGSLPVSGWDLARGGPKPNRFAVPAGSVYFLDRSTVLPSKTQSLCDDTDADIGWGCFTRGIWRHA